MQEQVIELINKYEDLSRQLSSQEVFNDSNKFQELSKEQGGLTEAYSIAKQLQKLYIDINDAQEMLKQESASDMKDFYSEVLDESSEKLEHLEQEFKKLTVETDPNDKRNCIVEIRAGTGGDEAALFAGDLYRMYHRYAETQSWKIEHLHSNKADNGGFKEIVFTISGKNVYGKLKFESGVHRVQRVPATESSGRIHTSAASVVVLPEVEDVEVEVKDEDIKVDVYRSSGPGGQSVNTTDSAVRITHIPTGIVVTCQDEKSQLKNRAKALAVLKSRLYDIELQRKEKEERSQRQSAISGGDRSAKIRTYNFPQSRVTDHRIKKTWHNLTGILDGDLEEVFSTVRLELTEQD